MSDRFSTAAAAAAAARRAELEAQLHRSHSDNSAVVSGPFVERYRQDGKCLSQTVLKLRCKKTTTSLTQNVTNQLPNGPAVTIVFAVPFAGRVVYVASPSGTSSIPASAAASLSPVATYGTGHLMLGHSSKHAQYGAMASLGPGGHSHASYGPVSTLSAADPQNEPAAVPSPTPGPRTTKLPRVALLGVKRPSSPSLQGQTAARTSSSISGASLGHRTARASPAGARLPSASAPNTQRGGSVFSPRPQMGYTSDAIAAAGTASPGPRFDDADRIPGETHRRTGGVSVGGETAPPPPDGGAAGEGVVVLSASEAALLKRQVRELLRRSREQNKSVEEATAEARRAGAKADAARVLLAARDGELRVAKSKLGEMASMVRQLSARLVRGNEPLTTREMHSISTAVQAASPEALVVAMATAAAAAAAKAGEGLAPAPGLHATGSAPRSTPRSAHRRAEEGGASGAAPHQQHQPAARRRPPASPAAAPQASSVADQGSVSELGAYEGGSDSGSYEADSLTSHSELRGRSEGAGVSAVASVRRAARRSPQLATGERSLTTGHAQSTPSPQQPRQPHRATESMAAGILQQLSPSPQSPGRAPQASASGAPRPSVSLEAQGLSRSGGTVDAADTSGLSRSSTPRGAGAVTPVSPPSPSLPPLMAQVLMLGSPDYHYESESGFGQAFPQSEINAESAPGANVGQEDDHDAGADLAGDFSADGEYESHQPPYGAGADQHSLRALEQQFIDAAHDWGHEPSDGAHLLQQSDELPPPSSPTHVVNGQSSPVSPPSALLRSPSEQPPQCSATPTPPIAGALSTRQDRPSIRQDVDVRAQPPPPVVLPTSPVQPSPPVDSLAARLLAASAKPTSQTPPPPSSTGGSSNSGGSDRGGSGAGGNRGGTGGSPPSATAGSHSPGGKPYKRVSAATQKVLEAAAAALPGLVLPAASAQPVDQLQQQPAPSPAGGRPAGRKVDAWNVATVSAATPMSPAATAPKASGGLPSAPAAPSPTSGSPSPSGSDTVAVGGGFAPSASPSPAQPARLTPGAIAGDGLGSSQPVFKDHISEDSDSDSSTDTEGPPPHVPSLVAAAAGAGGQDTAHPMPGAETAASLASVETPSPAFAPVAASPPVSARAASPKPSPTGHAIPPPVPRPAPSSAMAFAPPPKPPSLSPPPVAASTAGASGSASPSPSAAMPSKPASAAASVGFVAGTPVVSPLEASAPSPPASVAPASPKPSSVPPPPLQPPPPASQPRPVDTASVLSKPSPPVPVAVVSLPVPVASAPPQQLALVALPPAAEESDDAPAVALATSVPAGPARELTNGAVASARAAPGSTAAPASTVTAAGGVPGTKPSAIAGAPVPGQPSAAPASSAGNSSSVPLGPDGKPLPWSVRNAMAKAEKEAREKAERDAKAKAEADAKAAAAAEKGAREAAAREAMAAAQRKEREKKEAAAAAALPAADGEGDDNDDGGSVKSTSAVAAQVRPRVDLSAPAPTSAPAKAVTPASAPAKAVVAGAAKQQPAAAPSGITSKPAVAPVIRGSSAAGGAGAPPPPLPKVGIPGVPLPKVAPAGPPLPKLGVPTAASPAAGAVPVPAAGPPRIAKLAPPVPPPAPARTAAPAAAASRVSPVQPAAPPAPPQPAKPAAPEPAPALPDGAAGEDAVSSDPAEVPTATPSATPAGPSPTPPPRRGAASPGASGSTSPTASGSAPPSASSPKPTPPAARRKGDAAVDAGEVERAPNLDIPQTSRDAAIATPVPASISPSPPGAPKNRSSGQGASPGAAPSASPLPPGAPVTHRSDRDASIAVPPAASPSAPGAATPPPGAPEDRRGGADSAPAPATQPAIRKVSAPPGPPPGPPLPPPSVGTAAAPVASSAGTGGGKPPGPPARPPGPPAGPPSKR